MPNFTFGLLGHVDSGKTAIAVALSTEKSTACFDKHPQSQERGITLDIGFSSFFIGDNRITLCDCPGHSSFLKTVLSGAQIIDFMILVVDVTKGLQVQSYEGLIIGEIITDNIIIALNKCDLVTPDVLDKLRKQVSKVMKKTHFSKKSYTIVYTTAVPSLQKVASDVHVSGVEQLKEAVASLIASSGSAILERRRMLMQKQFVCLFDHCFTIKGRGTVVTGSVASGTLSLKPSASVYVSGCDQGAPFEVRSMQVFHKDVASCTVGDRVGLNIPGLRAEEHERGIVSSTPLVSTDTLLCDLEIVRFYKGEIKSGRSYSVTIGHTTVSGTLYILLNTSDSIVEGDFEDCRAIHSIESIVSASCHNMPVSDFVLTTRQTSALGIKPPYDRVALTAVIKLEKPVYLTTYSQLIGTRLDYDTCKSATTSRIAFAGTVWSHEQLVSSFERLFGRDTQLVNATYSQMVKGFSSKFKHESILICPGSVDKIIGDDIIVKNISLDSFAGGSKKRQIVEASAVTASRLIGRTCFFVLSTQSVTTTDDLRMVLSQFALASTFNDTSAAANFLDAYKDLPHESQLIKAIGVISGAFGTKGSVKATPMLNTEFNVCKEDIMTLECFVALQSINNIIKESVLE